MQGNKPTAQADTQAYCECFNQRRSQSIHWTPDGGVCQTCGLPMPTQHAGELPPDNDDASLRE